MTSRSGTLRTCFPMCSCSNPFCKLADSGNSPAAGSQPRKSLFSFRVSSATGVCSAPESINCHRCTSSSSSEVICSSENRTPSGFELPPKRWATSFSFPKKRLPRPTSPVCPGGKPCATKSTNGFSASTRSRTAWAISSAVPPPVIPHKRKLGSRWVLLLCFISIRKFGSNGRLAANTAHTGSPPLNCNCHPAFSLASITVAAPP